MEAYKIVIFPSAQRDIQEIVEYLNTLSPDVALKYYDVIVSEIASLSSMPLRYPHPRDLSLAAKGYRYMNVKNYLVFYIVSGNTVQIHRILYAKRDYSRLL